MRVLNILILGGLVMAMTASSAGAQSTSAATGSIAGRLVLCRQLQRPMGAPDEAVDPSLNGSLDSAIDGALSSGLDANVGVDASTTVDASTSADASAALDPSAAEDASVTIVDANADAALQDTSGVRRLQRVPPDLSDVTPGLRRFRAPGFAMLPVPNVEVKVLGAPVSAKTDANGQFVLQGVPAAQPMTVAAELSATSASTSALTLQMQNVVVNPGQTLNIGTLGLSGCGVMLTPRGDGQNITVQVQVGTPNAVPGGQGSGSETDVPTPGQNQQLPTDQPRQLPPLPQRTDGIAQ